MCLAKMCQKRVKKIKRGSTLTRQREARRLMRLQHNASPPSLPRDEDKANIDSATPNTSSPQFTQPHIILNLNNPVHVAAQKRALLELAWKTVALLQRNRLIQQKIIELQRETNEYVASVLQNPTELSFHLQQMGQYGALIARPATESESDTKTIKTEVEDEGQTLHVGIN